MVPVLRGAWITWLEPWTTSPLRKAWMTPLWAGGVSPSGTSPFSSFTSSLVAVIILLLAISAPCCVYWGQLHHRPPSQFLLYNHCTGAEELWREYECVCMCVCVCFWGRARVYMCPCQCTIAYAVAFMLKPFQSLTHICPSLSRCADQNECKEFGNSVCGTWHCENTIGSYRCFMGCQPGLQGEYATDCGEWSNRMELYLIMLRKSSWFWGCF